MSTTRLQEVQICFGFGKQTDIATANLVAAMWRLRKLNAQLANPKLNTENDAEEYGKGHEFATDHVQDVVGRGRHAGKVSERGDGRVGHVLRLGQGREERLDAELHLHLHSADPGERRRDGIAVLLVRRADPPGRWRR